MIAALALAAALSVPPDRLVIGDSLSVSVSWRLERQGFAVEAQRGRSWAPALDIVSGYGDRLPTNVVVELGTNGRVTVDACRRLVQAAGPTRRVFLVTSRSTRKAMRANNRALHACDRSFAAGRVSMIGWYKHSAGHPYLRADGIHLTLAGRRAFARLIDGAVDRRGLPSTPIPVSLLEVSS